MLQIHVDKISQELNLQSHQVSNTITLLDQDSSVPFISRYRKEMTGSLDEVQVTQIRDRLHQLRELDKRRVAILKSIDEQGKLTEDLKKKIAYAETMSLLEDLYLPYKPKRRTRALMAKEKGLEPLATVLLNQEGKDFKTIAEGSVQKSDDLEDIEQALAGARDIIAEWISENANVREALRNLYLESALVNSRVIMNKEEEGEKFRDYFEFQESARTIPSHRMLAIRRGEKEKVLMFRLIIDEDAALRILENSYLKSPSTPESYHVQLACEESLKRLLKPSIETEIRLELKKQADSGAIEIFKKNLYEMLMESPLGQKRVMAIDPGFRTGCKVVCLNEQGKLECFETIYLIGSDMQQFDAVETIKSLVKKYRIEFIAVGNGTACRETEQFVKKLKLGIPLIIVNESGASIYSASEIARTEFPNEDVTVRGSVSIGRRLMDPLAELVKIDAKSIGVGQYQHDVDQRLLKQSLDDIVVSCVNQVGVDLNSASAQLLSYVSGIGPKLGQTIVNHRNDNGRFENKKDLKKVPGLGEKVFEQAAGFIRISDAKNPLDRSAVHPESFSVVEQMAKDLQTNVAELMTDSRLRSQIDLENYVTDTIGLPTLEDIYEEMGKPGRDPRDEFEIFEYKEGVETLNDLKSGMVLPGVVTNVTAFGAFVDIGVHCDGLVHISQLSDSYVSDPNDVVSVHQKVQVSVQDVEIDRQRISLTMKGVRQ